MQAHNQKIVICGGSRTPIGHISRSLANITAPELIKTAVTTTMDKVGVPKGEVDGLIIGWVGQDFSAPNIARVTLLNCGIPDRGKAVTVQNNCVSSIESIAMAARFILSGEGDLFIAGGVESMSRLPYSIVGSRAAKELRSLATVTGKWADIPTSQEVKVVDAMEQGLTDPVKKINLAGTAEVCSCCGIGKVR